MLLRSIERTLNVLTIVSNPTCYSGFLENRLWHKGIEREDDLNNDGQKEN
ncbi:MAG TPA: hypothetical protein VFA85_03340 [Terriglobales bacterium]|nr:hypothetical protein [Terriglobales bacterium]